MDHKQLVATGLSEQQARAYALLLEKGGIKPSAAAKPLGTSRSNAYKIFDTLVEMGLATRQEIKKLYVYKPSNPLALANLASELRAEATARENAVNSTMGVLLDKYYEYVEQPSVEVGSGRKEVANAYRKQIGLKEDIYFIRSKADISLMGFDTMHEIRTAPVRYGLRRHAIMEAPAHNRVNYESHERSNLEVTWAKENCYDAPVEWSVTRSSLLIVLYGSEPQAIFVASPMVAGAFLQLWQLLSGLLKAQKTHQRLSRSAS